MCIVHHDHHVTSRNLFMVNLHVQNFPGNISAQSHAISIATDCFVYLLFICLHGTVHCPLKHVGEKMLPLGALQCRECRKTYENQQQHAQHCYTLATTKRTSKTTACMQRGMHTVASGKPIR